MIGGLEINADGLRQIANLNFGVIEGVEVHFGAEEVALASRIGVRLAGLEHLRHVRGELIHVRLFETALSDPRRAEAQAGGVERGLVAGDGVAVDDDSGDVENTRREIAHERRAVRAHDRFAIEVEEMGLGAAEWDSEAVRFHLVGEANGVDDRLFLQRLVFGRGGQFKSQRQPDEDVDVRAALLAGEHGAINFFRQHEIGGEDARAARAVHGFVRGEGDDVRVTDGRGVHAGDDQTGDVRHVCEQQRAHRVGNFAEALEVGRPGVRRVADDDHLWLVFFRQPFHFVHVNPFGLRIDGVGDDVVILATAVDGRAVREVAAEEQVHAHHRVARVDEGVIHGVVGRAAGEGLHVDENLVGADVRGGEKFGAAAAGEGFHRVGILHAFVIARVGVAAVVRQPCLVIEDFDLGQEPRLVVGVAFGVNIVEGGGERFAHSQRRGAFGSDEDQFAVLPLGLNVGQFGQLWVEVAEGAAEEEVGHRCS